MTNKMWGGRFSSGPSEIMEEINASIDFDKRLYAQDIAASKAHCAMLAETGIIAADEAASLIKGLDAISAEIEDGAFTFSRALEDIHMNIEARLEELVGPVAGKLHTARSRNDQVATDFKLYVRDAIDGLDGQLRALQSVLADQALAHAGTVMPGYTHLQTAQPITFGHHCLAYVEMLARDRGRLADARARLNECPLGAGALAGTSFPIDRISTARALGFEGPAANSLDAVSDRDFALEALGAAAISAVHLSRLAEEIVLWSTSEFGFVILGEGYTTGSSMMPQKRNPDAAELIRAKAGRVIADLQNLLIVMKGLPLAYSKDMQEDKEATFDALDALGLMLAAMTGMIEGLKVNDKAMKKSAAAGHSTATDLADWLVRSLGLPFREAHHVTGRIVAAADEANLPLWRLPLETMQQFEKRITDDVFEVLSVAKSVKSRTSEGGTAPKNVRKAARSWIKRLERESRSG